MTDPEIAAATLALRTFTLAQLAAFTGRDPDEAAREVRELAEWIGPVADGADDGLWRVVEPDALRAHIHAQHDVVPPAVLPRPSAAPDLPELRLARAEETLLDCAVEPSAPAREVMAATAETYLRQYVADNDHAREWWQVSLPSPTRGEPAADEGDQRLRVNVAMASMTRCEAQGLDVPSESLVRTATAVLDLVQSVHSSSLRPLVERFFELANAMTRPALQGGDEGAPDQLIGALGWRRVKAQAEPNLERATGQAVALLRWVDGGPDEHSGLFRFLEHLPGGLNRLSVYADLLPILPDQYTLESAADIVPGALVEVLADSSAASHLQGVASELEADLVQAPFHSDSALIGVVAARFEDLAARGAELDDGVLSRSVTKREELLSLADVAFRPAASTTPGWGWEGDHVQW